MPKGSAITKPRTLQGEAIPCILDIPSLISSRTMAQPAGSASPSQELPVSAPARYMTSAPVHWSYHYDAKPAARQRLPAAVSCPCPFEEPPQEDMNALLANALYDSIRASFPYILQTQYNYGVDTAGNVWGAYGYTPVRFAPERTRAAQLNQQAQQRIRTGK